MAKPKHMTVEEILTKVDVSKKPIVERVRNLIRQVFPKATETVRKERIEYTLNGKVFSGIRVTKQHVDLMFLNNPSLSSPRMKGQGTIGDPKHIEIYALKSFDEAETQRLLKEEAAASSA